MTAIGGSGSIGMAPCRREARPGRHRPQPRRPGARAGGCVASLSIAEASRTSLARPHPWPCLGEHVIACPGTETVPTSRSRNALRASTDGGCAARLTTVEVTEGYRARQPVPMHRAVAQLRACAPGNTEPEGSGTEEGSTMRRKLLATLAAFVLVLTGVAPGIARSAPAPTGGAEPGAGRRTARARSTRPRSRTTSGRTRTGRTAR